MTLRVLIVEDEMTIALMIENMVMDLGHEVVELAMRLPRAIEVAREAEIDFAILDVNLDGRMSFPVADVLTERGVPFVFATGYGSAGIEGSYKGRPILSKPFGIGDLRSALERAA